MSILNTNDGVPVVDNHSFKTQQELKTSTVFNNELSVEKIKYQVDGMRWTVDFFNQILNVNTQPIAPDVNIPETTLKYNRIDKLDIYVTAGLPDGTVTDITGTGTINAGFIPYFGDAFTATLAGGRIGIFVITAVQKEYYNTHDIYIVDFKLTYFLDTSGVIYNDLVYKTVRTYVYDKDAVDTFSTPVLLAKDYVQKLDLAKQPIKIMNHYLKLFYDTDTKFLRLPTSASMYVDQLVVSAIFGIVSVNDVPELASLSRTASGIDSVTIWDAILKRDMELFNVCNIDVHYGINSVSNPISNKLVSYLGVSYLITDRVATLPYAPAIKDNPLTVRKTVESPVTAPDGKYLFSSAFYAQDPSVSFSGLETVLIEYIRGDIPNRAIVEQLLTEYPYWSYEHQYTLLPILLIIVKSLVVNTYSAL